MCNCKDKLLGEETKALMYALHVVWSIRVVIYWSSMSNWLSRSLFCGSS